MVTEKTMPTGLQRVISVMVANQPDGGTSVGERFLSIVSRRQFLPIRVSGGRAGAMGRVVLPPVDRPP